MPGTWQDFLNEPAAADHAVQVYSHTSELAESVASYLAAGFQRAEPAVVIATPEHWECFAERLDALGWSAPPLEARGLLVLVDSATTLDAITANGSPSATRFAEVVESRFELLAERFPDARVRAFGDMVDLLNARGDADAAVALETLWNRVAARRGFSLLCAYRADIFDRDAQVSLLPAVCHTHSHVLPAGDLDRLQRAVDSALDETLGPEDSGKIYALIADQMRQTRVPGGQLALMWISAHLPSLSSRVLEVARLRYVNG